MGLFNTFKNKNGIPYFNFIKKVNKIDLKEKSDNELRKAVNDQGISDDMLFAIIKEIIYRVKNINLFDTQISAAYAMVNGKITELLTGEGKTYAAVVSAIYFCNRKKTIHILVFNDYLAKRDFTDNKEIFDFCDISSSFIQENTDKNLRKQNYAKKVVYVSAKEAGFDFLRNFLATTPDELVYTEHDVAIVDEADSILIDEARIPLVLAGDLPTVKDDSVRISHAIQLLDPCDIKILKTEDKVWLTDKGISKVEDILEIDNIYSEENINILALLNAGLKAHYLLSKDKEYIVKDNNIFVIDETTGRISKNRRFPDIIHNALEIKEQIAVGSQTMIYNSTTIQSFLMRYSILCGMTGTIETSKKELFNMYDLEVCVVPPALPCIRNDHKDEVFFNDKEKQEAVINEIIKANKKGQPVLLGTASVKESEEYSNILKTKGIDHSVLNARNDELEAEIISKAGMPYAVTVSTNMAGRGVDIKLGKNNKKDKEFVTSVGGLYVISTLINPSIRIDNQLRGRSGRRGDIGESKFFVSLEDPLVCAYFKENNIDDDNKNSVLSSDAKESVSELIRKAQKLEEGRNAESRYMLEKYSQIIEEQRCVIEKYRTDILKSEKEFNILADKEPNYYIDLISRHSEQAVKNSQRQLILYFINLYWAQYLASMEDVRNGIHLMVVGGKSPIFEYNKIAIQSFKEMMEDINNSVIKYMHKCKITEDGIDMQNEGLSGASTTWTYIMDDSTSQFSRIPHLIKAISSVTKNPLAVVDKILHDKKS